jgi:hypothetical protein
MPDPQHMDYTLTLRKSGKPLAKGV